MILARFRKLISFEIDLLKIKWVLVRNENSHYSGSNLGLINQTNELNASDRQIQSISSTINKGKKSK